MTRLLASAWFLLAGAAVVGAAEPGLALAVSTGDPARQSAWQEAQARLPGEQTFRIHAPTSSWVRAGRIAFDLWLPASGPTNAQALLYLKDWDYFWYQNLAPGFLTPGCTNHFAVDMTPSAVNWEPRGHHGTWHLAALMEPKEVGVRLFSRETWQGPCRLGRVVLHPRADADPPWIRRVRVNGAEVPRFGLFEATFDIPDRYPDPYDSDEVAVQAEVTVPGGRTVTVDGFYARNYLREVESTGEEISPQGPPFWRVRFTPTAEGVHTYRLKVRDRFGQAEWGPGRFTVTPSDRRGFVRVSSRDPRHFEFDDGSYFFPIGHNIRSPFDERHDRNFPWMQRWPEGSASYVRYFRDMQRHGETLAEIWTAAWSLGLEWSPMWRGYHGIGLYNMKNAWELDLVMAEAERRGIYLNVVIHNHGKFGAKSDKEWEFNPFNVQNGGYLNSPEEYFTDPRALRAFRKLMRYMVARWGYSTHVFAWELWSELNLTGNSHDFYRQPEVVDWHRLMGRAIKRMDVNRHMISTHYSGDYTVQNVEIVTLPEMDLAPVDAYHQNTDPLHIVDLVARTAGFNNRFGKPVVITEFGGSSQAHDVRHLGDTLHAALWASTCVPIGATPMFWWWHVIEEENFYPKFAAVARFMQGEDRRAPDMAAFSAGTADPQVPAEPELQVEALGGGPAGPIAARCCKNWERALGWIYNTADFERLDPEGAANSTNLVLRLSNLLSGNYAVEFWNTTVGRPVATRTRQVVNGVLAVEIPPFSRDIAFKLRRQGSLASDSPGKTAPASAQRRRAAADEE